MRVFVTGATGFVGQEIVKRLAKDGHDVTALIRRQSASLAFSEIANIKTMKGDVTNPSSLEGLFDSHDVVIHLVGIIREFPSDGITFQKLHIEATQNVVNAVIKAGIKRYVHMSALGTSKKAKGAYFATKWIAEEIVRGSRLDFTIFRPSMIYGPRDQFTNMIADMIRKYRVFPMFNDGKNRMQPIAVEDIAEAFSKSLKTIISIGRTYDAVGLNVYEFREIVNMIAKAADVSVFTPSVSSRIVSPFAASFGKYKWFPMTSNQLEMLLADNISENKIFFEDFDIIPIDFKDGIKKYIRKKK